MVAALTEDGGGAALIYDYGVPIFRADADTPRVQVTCTMADWGPCPLEGEPIPIPPEARPSSGHDGAMVVIDDSSGRVYDFWQAKRTSSGHWTLSWGTWAALDGDGSGGESGGVAGGATGAGVNVLAGVVRRAEIRAGRIDHALAFASHWSCAGVFRYPATKTDGQSTSWRCLPEGARLQLDPSIDVAGIPGITPGEVAVAKALQTYGAYLRDSGGTAMGFAFETPTGGDDPYPSVARFPWDYYDMPHIPWSHLRVLARWDGS